MGQLQLICVIADADGCDRVFMRFSLLRARPFLENAHANFVQRRVLSIIGDRTVVSAGFLLRCEIRCLRVRIVVGMSRH